MVVAVVVGAMTIVILVVEVVEVVQIVVIVIVVVVGASTRISDCSHTRNCGGAGRSSSRR